MTKIFEKISDKNHEQVIYCNDPSSGLKAIIAVHTYGLPCEIKEISEYCKENSIILIEDAAEAHNIFVGDNLFSLALESCNKLSYILFLPV